MESLLRMTGISKRYPNGVVANDGAWLDVGAGEIHAIAGENGAGKSTLMKILYGAIRPDSGEICFSGKSVNLTSPKDAASLGIGMVYQHFMLVDELPVWQNVFLGIEKKKHLLLDIPAMKRETEELCRRFAMPMDVNEKCGHLPVGVRQKVEILKVLARGAKLIILDEPTAVLTPQETEQLFVQLRLLRDSGHTIVIITHKLKEIKALCDRVTIMRGGKTMGVYSVPDVTEQQISELMVGGSVRLKVDKTPAVPGEVKAELKHVTLAGKGGKPALDDVSLTVKAGEILCLAGVEGNGQQQVAELLTGSAAGYHGSITVCGSDIRRKSVRTIRELGLSHIPEDRMTVGTDQKEDIFNNLIAVNAQKSTRFGFIRFRVLKKQAEKQIADFRVKGQLRQGIGMLSGGNMQKVVLARELSQAPAIVVADQPTRGVDVGAIEFIHDKLVALRDSGCAILLISADLGEVLSLSDRICVFHDGKIAAEITDVEHTTEQEIGRYMLGIETKEAAV